jgi:serine/threonine-protein kinase
MSQSASPAPFERSSEDVTYARRAVRKGLVTEAEVEEAFQAQQEMTEKGLPRTSLASILKERGQIDPEGNGDEPEKKERDDFPRIKGYRIVSEIGSGGMGTVYKARQESLDRTVAIKVLDPLLSKDRKFSSRFLREARAVAALNHENIIVGIDVGKTRAGTFFFVMEYVEGETVYEVLRRDGFVPEKRSLEICLQIAHALDHADKHRLVHRDIKPDNILITPGGVAKLCDLGLAKSTLPKARLTQAGSTHGTPHYMSPEQAKGQEDVDIRSDLYSLGATLYHMITGEVPFDGASAAVILLKHISEDVPPPRRIRPDISDETQKLLGRMMAKKRENRYQTAEELIEDLDRLLAGESLKTWRIPLASGEDVTELMEAGPPRTGSEDPTQPFSRAMLLKRRDPVAFLLYAAMVAVVLSAAVAFVVRAAAGLEDAGSPPKRTNGVKDRPEPGTPSIKLREQKVARDNFEYLLGWEKRNPHQPEELVKRLMKSVIVNFPATGAAQRALEKVEEVCRGKLEPKVEKLREALMTEREPLMKANRIGDVLALFDPVLGRYQFVADYRLEGKVPAFETLRNQRTADRAFADKRRQDLEEEAGALEKKGNFAGALGVWKEIRVLGLSPSPAAKIADLERLVGEDRKARERKKGERVRKKFLGDFLANVVGAVSRRDFEGADRLCKEAKFDRDYADLKTRIDEIQAAAAICGKIWRKATAAVEILKSRSAYVLLRVKDSREKNGFRTLQGYARAARAGALGLYQSQDGTGYIQDVDYRDFIPEEVFELAGYDRPGLQADDFVERAVFYAFEGKYEAAEQELRRASHGGGKEDRFGDLGASIRDARAEARGTALFVEAEKAYARRDWDRVTRNLQELLEGLTGTIIFRWREEEIKGMLNQAYIAQTKKPDLEGVLIGTSTHRGGTSFRFLYDTAGANTGGLQQLFDWEPTGTKALVGLDPRSGALTVGGASGLRWKAHFLGDFEIELKLKVEDVAANVQFLSVDFEKGGSYVFYLNGGGGEDRIVRKAPDGTEEVVARYDGMPLDLGTDHTVTVAAKDEVLRLYLDNKQLCTTPLETKGAARLVLWGKPRPIHIAHHRIEIICTLDPAWLLRVKKGK